jgi:hypothetical protein
MGDASVRLELARKGYDEVLDATKHQDDKIGRFLTAIAFIFTGAIAFGARSDLIGVDVAISHQPVALSAVFLGLFLGLALLAVLLLLVALGPNLNLPSPERDQDETPGKQRSRIYFLSMDRMTADAWWKDQWESPGPTEEDAVRNYVYDSHNLAVKTTFKSGRTNEARAAFTLALLFLGLSIALSFEAAIRSSEALVVPLAADRDPYLLPWDMLTRVTVGLIVSVFAFVLAYDYLKYEQTAATFARNPWLGVPPMYAIVLGFPTVCFLLMLAPEESWGTVTKWTVLIVIVAIVVAMIVMLFRRGEGPPGRRTTWIVAYVLLGMVALVLTWGVLDRQRPGELLIAAIAWASLLELPRLSLGARTWARRKRSLRDNPHLALLPPTKESPQESVTQLADEEQSGK